MSQAVWKYKIETEDYIILTLPLNSEVLSVQEQFGEPQIWVLVDPDETNKEKRYFRLCGTGHKFIDPIKKFIGTFQLHKGLFVGHLFELWGR